MLAQQIFNGLALGMGYALIAVGYSLVFGILRLVNSLTEQFMLLALKWQWFSSD